jgi:SagB-type dehydrogenase family enzyme
MSWPYVLSFRRDVSVVEEGEERANLRAPLGTQALSGLSPAMLDVLRALAGDGATENQLADLLIQHGDTTDLARLYYELERWKRWRLVRYSLVVEGPPVATVEPISPSFRFGPEQVAADARYVLSRFAYCRRGAGELVLESPLSHARTVLAGSLGARLVAELATPSSYVELAARIEGLAEDVAQAFMSLLVNAGVLSRVGEDGPAEEVDETLRQWEFHDLLYHSRSRIGRHDYPVGGQYRFVGQLPPQPALKPRMSEETIELFRPNLEQLMERDQPFTRVLEARRSVREYGDQPITARQLGEFLYRVARVRSITEPNPEAGLHYEASNRPYPSGGGSYDLELYLTVNTCVGIPSGIYHYDPLHHRLEKLAERNAHAEALLRDAWLSAARLCMPQVLITLASRFQRLGWKYNAMAYSATLKNVGVLYQTLYLVATAMGLAPCALGNGNSDLLAEAVGLDYLKESSVGELMLGSRRAGPDAR